LIAPLAVAQQPDIPHPRIKNVQIPIIRLRRAATISLGGAPDWLAISDDAVWVANSKLKAVQRIDPKTNSLVGKVEFSDEPCSGLAFAFGTLWVPLCGTPASLARVDPHTNKIVATLPFGPADSEGGITASDDSIWLIGDENGTLFRIDPRTNTVRQKIHIPAGSFNPLYSQGFVWIAGNKSGVLTPVNASTGEVLAPIPVGPQPRFLAADTGYIWTLNQGDGSITRVDAMARRSVATIHAGIPGHGGDLCYGAGAIWATVFDIPLTMIFVESDEVLHQWVGPGGDAIRFGLGSLWLTNLRNGLLWRIDPPKP
jgi:DNA-binding beta-propeller fold protein YncE